MKTILSSKITGIYIIILIVLITCFFVINLWLWIGFKDFYFSLWEADKHMGFACAAAEYLLTDSQELYYLLFFWPYPPLYYIPAIILILITNHTSESIIILSLAAFFPLIAFSAYKLGEQIDSPTGGMTLAILSCAFYFMNIQQDGYTPDNSLSGWIMAGLFFLAAAKGFKNKKYSCLFGICIGFGILTKWTYPIFILLPLILSVFNKFRKNKTRKIINIILAGSCAFITASPWYCQHFSLVITYLTHTAGFNNDSHSYLIPPIQILPSLFGGHPLTIYLSIDNLPTKDSMLLFLLSITALINIMRIRRNQAGAFPAVSILGAFLVISLAQTPEPRFLRPSIPLIFASVLAAIKPLPLYARRIIYSIASSTAILFSLSWTGLPPIFSLNADIFPCNTQITAFKDPLGALTDFKTTSGEILAENMVNHLNSCSFFFADKDMIFIKGLVSQYYFMYLIRTSPLTNLSKFPDQIIVDKMLNKFSNSNIYTLQQSLPDSLLIDVCGKVSYDNDYYLTNESFCNNHFFFTRNTFQIQYYYLKSTSGQNMHKTKCLLIAPSNGYQYQHQQATYNHKKEIRRKKAQ